MGLIIIQMVIDMREKYHKIEVMEMVIFISQMEMFIMGISNLGKEMDMEKWYA